MADHNQYVEMMINSLEKKSYILDRILEKNEKQAEIIAQGEYESIRWDQFNVIIAEKDELIDRINELDDGFETLYNRVKEELNVNKDKHVDEIVRLKELIGEVTDKGVQIQTSEEKNRSALEKVLLPAKKEIRESKKSIRVVSDYYKTMSKASLASEFTQIDNRK